MHRFILGLGYGDRRYVDHEDGDRLNNQRSNIRICGNTQNQRNKRLSGGNTSGFKGVSWNAARRKWIAAIQIGEKVNFLGRYEDKMAAAHAYNRAAIKYFGEFAVLNPVEGTVEVNSFEPRKPFKLTDQLASEIASSTLTWKDLAQLHGVSMRTIWKAKSMHRSK